MLVLKFALAALGMTLIIPLAVWGATGSFKHAMFAWKQYMTIMALIAAPAAIAGLLAFILP